MTHRQEEWIHIAILWLIIWLLFFPKPWGRKQPKRQIDDSYYSDSDYRADKWETRARPDP